MKPFFALFLLLTAGLALTLRIHAQQSYRQAGPRGAAGIESFAMTAHRSRVPRALRRSALFSVPITAIEEVKWTACQGDAADLKASCGTVGVPLDRYVPNAGTISIFFELYTHTGNGPAESAILFNLGGPGLSSTAFRDLPLDLFEPNLVNHDLLLIDDCGRGSSGAVNCPDLQQDTAAWDDTVARCAAQLGMAASRYGSGDVAADTEAIQAALGYESLII